MKFRVACTGLGLAVCLMCGVGAFGQQWQPPTAEELTMTTQPEVPGASAVYLYREQTTDDRYRMFSFYVRLKVLTEGGKDFANVELPYFAGREGVTIDGIAGRTIHPDGTVIPFTGKPYDKFNAKMQGLQAKSKVFTLPGVEVGSILEYRYKLHYDDAFFESPDWYIQSDLFMRKAHYLWRPTESTVASSKGDILNRIAYTPILPDGDKVVMKDLNTGRELSLDISNVPPLPHEEYMPPMGSVSYRVLFYYTQYTTTQEFWTKRGKDWSKAQDKFIGPGSGVKAFVAGLVSPGDSQDAKVKKIYDAVMKLENTDFTREHSAQEDKSEGFKQINTTDDVLARKRGSGDQLADLFIAMVRAAGLKAYVLGTTDRSRRIFIPSYLSLTQLDDDLALVEIDGHDRVFDPGQRYCRYGDLAWQHTQTSGLRQTETGTALVGLPAEPSRRGHTSRIADLKLDEHGEASGTVTLTFEGAPALRWRQRALRGDDASLNSELKTSLEHQLPGGMEIRVVDVKNLTDPDKPLSVVYSVKGAIGTPTGKRLLIAGQLFESNSKPTFPGARRDVPVDLHYSHYTQDAVRLTYPDSFTVESLPAPEAGKLAVDAAFSTNTKRGTSSITLYRNFEIAKALYEPKEYANLRAFYSKLETKDQEPLVLIRSAAVSSDAANGASTGTAK